MKAKSLLAAFGILLLFACSRSGGSSPASAGATSGIFVSAFAPSAGEVGDLVTIEGAKFGTDPFAVQVRFNGLQGTPGTVQLCTEDRLLVTVPPGSSTGKIAVLSPAGSFLTSGEFQVFPSVTGLNPPSPPGAIVGSVVEIMGFGFDGEVPANNTVSFSGLPATVLDASSTRLDALVPVGATTGELIVVSPTGAIVRPYTILPSITGVNIDYGLPGTTIALAGFNFQGSPSANQVAFNGTPAVVGNASYSSLEVTVPAGFSSGPITVTTPDGIAQGPVFYLPQTPSIADFQPISGIAGQLITIQGSGFLPGATSVSLQGVSMTVQSVTTTQIEVLVPAGATTGNLEVAHPFAQTASANVFTVLQPPGITNFSPLFGTAGTVVTIAGSDFDPNLAGNQVKFQGVNASVLQATPTQLVAQVPHGASSGAITLQTQAGLASSAVPFSVSYARHAVVANEVESTISVYEMDRELGDLRYRNFVFTGADSLPSALCSNPSGNLILATFRGLNRLTSYSLTPDGQLSFRQSANTGQAPSSVTVHPSGNFAFVTNRSDSNVSVFELGPNGELISVENRGTGREPLETVVHPNGSFLYCANSQNSLAGNSVTVYSIHPLSGSLTLLQRKASDAGPSSLLLHPNGGLLYAACADAGTVQVFAIGGDGKLSLLRSVSAGSKPVKLVADPYFAKLFVADANANAVCAFSLDSAGGIVEPGSCYALSGSPGSLMVDFSGRVYATQASANEVSILSLNSGGALQSLGSTLTHRGPSAMARVDGSTPLKITPRFAYVANTFFPPSPNGGIGERTVLAMDIAANGSLSVNAGGALQAGPRPESMVVDPLGACLFTANRGNTTGIAAISQFRIDGAGSLVANGDLNLSSLPGNFFAFEVNAEASGQFVLGTFSDATTLNSGMLRAYRIDRSSGNFGRLLATGTGPLVLSSPSSLFFVQPIWTTVHPQGRFAYALADDAGAIQIETVFVDLESGQLSYSGANPFGVSNSNSIFVHPHGRFLYRAASNNKIFVHPISASGTVTSQLASSFDTGAQPFGMAFTPNGRFLYVANRGSDSVSAYAVNVVTGLLTPIDANPGQAGVQHFPAGDEPFRLEVDRSGSYLFVANSGNCSGPGCFDPSSATSYGILADGSLASTGLSVLTGEAPKSIGTVCEYQ